MPIAEVAHPADKQRSLWSRPGQLVLLILAGLYVSWMFSLNINWSLQKAFGFVSRDNSLLEFLIHGTCALIGGFYVGFFVKKRGAIAGLMVAGASIAIWAALIALLLGASMSAESVTSLEQLDPEATQPLKLFTLLFIPMVLGCSAAGGVLGERFAFSEWGLHPVIRFYLRFDWKILLTTYLIVECLRIVLQHLDTIWFHVLWLTLGNIYVLVSPSLWFVWDVAGWASMIMFLAIIAVYLVCRMPLYIYNIFHRTGRRLAAKLGLGLASYLGVLFAAVVMFTVSESPVRNLMNDITMSGKSIWPILLTKEMRPVAYDNLTEYHRTKGDEDKATVYARKASEAHYKVGMYYYNGDISVEGAIEEMEAAIAADPENDKAINALAALIVQVDYDEGASEEEMEATGE